MISILLTRIGQLALKNVKIKKDDFFRIIHKNTSKNWHALIENTECKECPYDKERSIPFNQQHSNTPE